MPLPHADTARELKRRIREAARASHHVQLIQVHLTTLGILARNLDLRLAPTAVPGGDLVAEMRKEWPALDGLADSNPQPGDTLSVALGKRNTQLQLAARWLDTIGHAAHGAEIQLRQLYAEQQLALESPELADLAEELRQLQEQQHDLAHKLAAARHRHGSIKPVESIYQLMLARVDAELAAAARGVHYADWKALTMMRAMCDALTSALSATGHDGLQVPAPPQLSPTPLPIDVEARERTVATREQVARFHSGIADELAEIERHLVTLQAEMDATTARITAQTG